MADQVNSSYIHIILFYLHFLTFHSLTNFPRWLFLTGRLAPQYDYFRCVVNIPEDVQRVGEPSEIDGEQVSLKLPNEDDCDDEMIYLKKIFKMSVMAGAMNKMYGAATMVGKDERNGRINPALEADDDLPAAEAQRQMQQMAMSSAAAALSQQASAIPSGQQQQYHHQIGGQGSTAF